MHKYINIMRHSFLLGFFSYTLCCCKGQPITKSCQEHLYSARKLVFKDTIISQAMDSALVLVDKSLGCTATRKAAVDLKVFILTATEKNLEGMTFVESLDKSDFLYNYKKEAAYRNFLARKYNLESDTLRRDSTYKKLAGYLESYISEKKVEGKEFEEIYADLFAVKSNFLDTTAYNKEVENLQQKYPQKSDFFSFFIKH